MQVKQQNTVKIIRQFDHSEISGDYHSHSQTLEFGKKLMGTHVAKKSVT